MPSGRADTAGDLARQYFMALASEDDLREAEATMRLARVRSLPVLDRDRLLGLAEHRSLLRALIGSALEPEPTLLPALPELLVVTDSRVAADAPLAQAAARLCRLGSGCIIVVEGERDEERVIGVLTESDLLRAALLRDA